MKLNMIFNTLSLAAVALFATACADTDAKYEIPDVAAPQFVSASLAQEAPIFIGETTIEVNFDQNINFASKNAAQITINGEPVDKAEVLVSARRSPSRRICRLATPLRCISPPIS